MSIRREINLLSTYCKGVGLNIGCGNVPIGDSIGVDMTPKAKAAIILADAVNLPFADCCFDYIVASACFEHIKYAPIIVLRHWLQFLKPGGIIAIIVPDAEYGIWSMTGDTGRSGKLVKPHREMEHLHAFTAKSLEMLFNFAGMDIVTLDVIDRQPERKEKTILCVGMKNNNYEKVDHDTIS